MKMLLKLDNFYMNIKDGVNVSDISCQVIVCKGYIESVMS